MKLVNLATKSFEEVPDDALPQVLGAGTHAFENAEQQIPMRGPDGTMGTVAAKDYHAAVAAGGEVVPHAEYRKAELEDKYGGVGGTLAATGEGAARGLTVGLSDPLAIGTAKLFGGEETAAKVRTHLAEEKEAHPIASTVGEVAGAAAPVLFSGGAAAPVEGAEIARGIAGAAEAAGGTSRLGSLLRAVGAPARGVNAAGEGAEALASRALDVVMGTPGAEGALGRITRQAVKSGVRGAAEGGLFGAGQQISEDALGDHELNAEKLVAAMGHGALYGGMLGGGLGAAGGAARETAGAVLNRIAPSLDRQADSQMWRSLSPLKKFTREAEERAGGAEAVGATLRKELDLPTNPLKAGLTVEDLAPKIDVAVTKKWGQMRDLMAATGGEVKGSSVVQAVDDVLAPLRKKAGFEGVVKSVESYKQSLLEKLSLGTEAEVSPAVAAVERKPRTAQEIADYLRTNPKAAEEMRASPGKLPDSIAFHEPVSRETPKAVMDKAVPVTDLMDQRKALDELVYKETKALDPNLRVEALRDVRAKMADLEVEAFDTAAKASGKTGVGDELRALRKDYQRLRIAQDAAADTQSRMATNNNLSLSDNMFGMAHFTGALAAGHPVGALGGIATAFAHKAVRERGNAMAAVALGRLAKLDLIARATQRVDGELRGAVRTFVAGESSAAPKVSLRHFASEPSDDVQKRYESSQAKAVEQPQAVTTEQLDRVFPEMSAHAPKHASAVTKVVNAGARYLANQQPKSSRPPDILGRPARVNDLHASQTLRVRGAVNDPVGTLVRGLETKKLHSDELAALRATTPKLVHEVGKMALIELAKHPEKDTYAKRLLLSKLTGQPLDPTLRPEFVASCQASYSPDLNKGSQDNMPSHGAPKRMLKGFSQDNALAIGQVRA